MTWPSLMAISPGDGRPLAPWIDALADAGLELLLLREPELPADALRRIADHARKRLVVVVHTRNAAAASLALPLHLPQGAASPTGVPWGASRHDDRGLDDAFVAGAAYALLSPVWKPNSKPDDRRLPLGLRAYLRLARGRPVYALGGATPARLGAVLRRGGHGVAVLGDLFHRRSPSDAARRMAVYRQVAAP